MKKCLMLLFVLAALASEAQLLNIDFSKKQITGDFYSTAKNNPDFTTQVKDSADLLHIVAALKETNRVEGDFLYYFHADSILDEIVCDSAVYKFSCSKCGDKHFGEILKMDKWKEVSPGIFYSKYSSHTIMRVTDFPGQEFCKLITFAKQYWTKEGYKAKTRGIRSQ